MMTAALAQPSSQTSTGPVLHQYACLRCRARRVRCDKIISGCVNCANHGMQCVYSARRPRKPMKVAQQQKTHHPILPRVPPAASQSSSTPSSTSAGIASSVEPTSDHETGDSEVEDEENTIIMRELRNGLSEASKADDSGGMLCADRHLDVIRGDSIISPKFTPSGGKKPKSFERINSIDVSSLLSSKPRFSKQELRALHPPPEVMISLWDHFTEHVDRMIKILYKPSIELLIRRAATDLNSIDETETPLLFAIWLSATLTLILSPTLTSTPTTHQAHHYRLALESALHHASYLTRPSLPTLQALTLYLFFGTESSPTTWTLSGLALSQAQLLSLHVEPPPNAPNPPSTLATELRRRIWWTLVQLDVRISDNVGHAPHVPYTASTQLPSHIDDADVPAAPSTAPVHARHSSPTEMTVTLVKLEVTRARLAFARSGDALEVRARILREQIARLHTEYLPLFAGPDATPFDEVCALGTRFAAARLWKGLFDACAGAEPPIALAYTGSVPSTSHSSFSSALEDVTDADADADPVRALLLYNADLLDIATALPCRYKQYGWFFRCRYTQWHALAYLLMQLCVHTQGAAVECAWAVVEGVVGVWEGKGVFGVEGQRGQLWEAVGGLLGRARAARDGARKSNSNGMDGGGNGAENIDENCSGAGASEEQIQVASAAPALTNGLIGDPFFGSVDDMDLEMNWERLDEWAKIFSDGYDQQRRALADQGQDMMDDFAWC